MLLASTGAPGGGTLIDLQPSNPESGGDPVPLAALDGGRVLLAGSDGDELGGEPRLFVSDGTLIGTHPLQPADLCGATPAPSCGFYAEGFGGQGWTFASRLVTTTASEGVVFAARAFSGSGDQPEPPVPWRTFDGSGVEDLTRGFSYDPAAALLSAYEIGRAHV